MAGRSSEGEAARFAYHAVPWRRPAFWGFAALVLFAQPAWIALLGAILVAALCLKGPHRVECRDEGLLLPGSARAFGRRLVPWSHVVSLHRSRLLGVPQLVVGIRARHAARFAEAGFALPEDAGRLASAIESRATALPDGRERRSHFAERAALARLAARGAPVLTLSLCGLLVAVFVLQWAEGALGPSLEALRLGAHAVPLVLHGEVERLVTYAFLHSGVPHLARNAVALALVGAPLERLLGATRLGWVLLISVLAANAYAYAVPFLQPYGLIGASAGVFGLFGSWLALQIREDELPGGLRPGVAAFWLGPLAYCWMLGVDLLRLEVSLPHIEHLAGFVAGFLATSAMLRGRPLLELARKRRAPAPATAALLLVAISCFAAAALHASRPFAPGVDLLLRQLDLEEGKGFANRRSLFAARVQAWPHATPEQRRWARRVLEAAEGGEQP